MNNDELIEAMAVRAETWPDGGGAGYYPKQIYAENLFTSCEEAEESPHEMKLEHG